MTDLHPLIMEACRGGIRLTATSRGTLKLLPPKGRTIAPEFREAVRAEKMVIIAQLTAANRLDDGPWLHWLMNEAPGGCPPATALAIVLSPAQSLERGDAETSKGDYFQ